MRQLLAEKDTVMGKQKNEWAEIYGNMKRETDGLKRDIRMLNKENERLVKQIEQIRGTLLQTLLSASPKNFEYPHGKKALMDSMRTSVNHFLGKDLVRGIRFTNTVLL